MIPFPKGAPIYVHGVEVAYSSRNEERIAQMSDLQSFPAERPR